MSFYINKIYCKNCPELQEVLKALVRRGIAVNGLGDDADFNYYAKSDFHGTDNYIGVAGSEKWWQNKGCIEVTPAQFCHAWFNTILPRDKIVCHGSVKLFEARRKLQDMGFHTDCIGDDPKWLYYVRKRCDGHLWLSTTKNSSDCSEYKLVSDINFFNYWKNRIEEQTLLETACDKAMKSSVAGQLTESKESCTQDVFTICMPKVTPIKIIL